MKSNKTYLDKRDFSYKITICQVKIVKSFIDLLTNSIHQRKEKTWMKINKQ